MSEALLRKLEARYGGSIPFARAATLLGISERVLLQRVANDEVLALDFGGQYHLPVFQFKNGGMIPGLSAILESAKAPPEEVIDFLVEEFINGESPVHILKAGITEVELEAIIAAFKGYFNGDLAP